LNGIQLLTAKRLSGFGIWKPWWISQGDRPERVSGAAIRFIKHLHARVAAIQRHAAASMAEVAVSKKLFNGSGGLWKEFRG
jgi:hypothetical protein